MSLIKMTFSGTLMILIVILIRSLITCRLPKRALLVFWGIALLRLLVPYNVSADIRALLPVNRAVFFTEGTADSDNEIIGSGTVGESIDIAKRTADAFVMRQVDVRLPRFLIVEFDFWNMVWIAGMVLATVFFVIAYLKWYREFKASLPVQNDAALDWLGEHKLKRRLEIRYSDCITSPLSYGVVRPVILMPKDTDWNDRNSLKYVLEHEYVHIRYLDAVLKFFLIAAVCVHWFNPFVWMMYVLANRDIELACDETVIKIFGLEERKSYAMMLVEMEEARNVFAPVANHFNRNAICTRIDAIVKMKKVSRPVLAFASVVMAAAFLVLGTAAKAEEWDGASGFFRFPLSEIDSEYVQERLRKDGIDTSSNQYKAVVSMMLDRPDDHPVEDAYTTNIVIRNQMKDYDDNGDYLVNGIAGLLITDENVENMRRIIPIPESVREEMFELAKEEFLRENGIANGDTTRRSEVYMKMYPGIAKEDRLAAGYTLGQYEREYNVAFVEAARAVEPGWTHGDEIPAGALSGITRESIEATLSW